MAKNITLPIAVRTLLASLLSMKDVITEYGLEGTGILPVKYQVLEFSRSSNEQRLKELEGAFGPDYQGPATEWFLVSVWLEAQAKVVGYVAKRPMEPHNWWRGQATFIRGTGTDEHPQNLFPAAERESA